MACHQVERMNELYVTESGQWMSVLRPLCSVLYHGSSLACTVLSISKSRKGDDVTVRLHEWGRPRSQVPIRVSCRRMKRWFRRHWEGAQLILNSDFLPRV